MDRQIIGKDFAIFTTRFKTTLKLIPIDVVDRTIQEIVKKLLSVKDGGSNTSFLTWKYFQMY